MARTTFTDEELSKRLLFEIIQHPQGGPSEGRVDFHGFYTQDALMRARTARKSFGLVEHWHKQNGTPVPMSSYLFFVASVFAEIESQDHPMTGKRIEMPPERCEHNLLWGTCSDCNR